MTTPDLPHFLYDAEGNLWAVVKNAYNEYQVHQVTLGEPLPEQYRFKYQAVRTISEACNG
jgi:hypothetical protein